MVVIIFLSIDYFGCYKSFCVAMSPFYVLFPVYDYPNSVLQSKKEYKKQWKQNNFRKTLEKEKKVYYVKKTKFKEDFFLKQPTHPTLYSCFISIKLLLNWV